MTAAHLPRMRWLALARAGVVLAIAAPLASDVASESEPTIASTPDVPPPVTGAVMQPAPATEPAPAPKKAMIAVRVTAAGVAVAGAQVVISDGTGPVSATAITDATGVAH